MEPPRIRSRYAQRGYMVQHEIPALFTVSRIEAKSMRGLAVSSCSSCCERSAAETTLRLTAGAGGAIGAAAACTITACRRQGLLWQIGW